MDTLDHDLTGVAEGAGTMSRLREEWLIYFHSTRVLASVTQAP